ncbi:MAG: flagellar hook-length control protein FliK [Deltaproteobacteria bacterium]|nr:flagellar hook-length control protein FliK [Deltaproteobacteria bacterium]
MADIDTKKIEAADAARAEQLRPKDKARPKDEPSKFDRILEQSRNPVQFSTKMAPQQAATEYAAREVKRDQGRRDDRRRDDDDQDHKGDSRRQDTGRKDETKGHERVISKEGAKEQSGDGRHGSGAGGFTSGRRDISSLAKKLNAKNSAFVVAQKFEHHLKESLNMEGARAPRLAQQIINQIVQCVRLGLNDKGEKEMAIELKEKIFRGLKLKVTSKNGKVAVEFATRDLQTKGLFESSRDELRQMLTEKGIDIDEILVS